MLQSWICFSLHDQKRQYQCHIDKEALPFAVSCIQIPDSVMSSCYTKEDAMQLQPKGSHGDLSCEGLPGAKHTEHLVK